MLLYQTLLISSKKATNILGIQTELQFKGAVRNQEKRLLLFIPKDSENVQLNIWKETVESESAFVQVAKTTIIPTDGTVMVHSKVANSNFKSLKAPTFAFEPFEDL